MRKGQHFLIDAELVRRIVSWAELSPGTRVLEIGPGTGCLTEALSRTGSLVYAVEADPTLAALLRSHWPNVEVVVGDALRVELPTFEAVVSNLPYQISSKFTLRILPYPFRVAVLMYQKEFVRRLLAPPGSRKYGRLAMSAAFFVRGEVLETVPRTAFSPQPSVSSAVVRLYPRGDRQGVDPDLFLEMAKALFTGRRKTVRRALETMLPRRLIETFEGSQMDMRPEDLGREEAIDLARRIQELGYPFILHECDPNGK